jgi:uracil-DNA glycosylase
VPAVLQDVAEAAAKCHACPLWENATQTVFGEGPTTARLMLVGEQPGDQEDQSGHPFVGPAGRVLDEALAAAELDRDHVYVTNAVKHFKWRPRGTRRIHDRPNRGEASACRPWLDQELELVHPEVVVTLGATAAQALLGWDFRLTRHRGEVLDGTGIAPFVVATTHPAMILRIPDQEERESARRDLADDLRRAARVLG